MRRLPSLSGSRRLFSSSSQRNKIRGIFIDQNIFSSLPIKQDPLSSDEQAPTTTGHHVEIPGLTLVTGKYSSKLREKNFSPLELALRKSHRGDASLLRSARDIVDQQSPYVISNQEMNKILKYIESRGLFGWILMSNTEPEEYREELKKTVAELSNVRILPDSGGGTDQVIEEIKTKFQHILPHQTLLVSHRDPILSFGNIANHLTTRFR
jgi:phosphatidylserine/phosphatidylglycerophosphate/cardiolipin synthase-like enzyme